MGKEKNRETEFLKVFLAIVPFFIGVFYEWTSGIVCLVLLYFLFNYQKRNGNLLLFNSLILTATMLIVIMYGISVLWAVDTGMALLGFAKFLPLPLFVFSVGQLEKKTRKELLDYIPIAGCVMVLVSGILALVPVGKIIFLVNSRLAGFFQYPNTFALFLLVGIIILLADNLWNMKKIIELIILIAGIMLTGSRTTFVLLLGVIVSFCIYIKEKRVRIGLLSGLGLVLMMVGIYVMITGNVNTIGRIFTISISSSTLLGRLLYFKDALPVILRSPFGLGYMGYYFSQGMFQTGVYSVMNIHNELLQIMLDVGWIPLLVLGVALGRGVVKGRFREKLLISVIVLHCMLDFDLQFISIFFILIAAVDLEEKNIKTLKSKRTFKIVAIVLSCVSVYFGTTSVLQYLGMNQEAVSIYPGNTVAWIELLAESEEIEEMEKIADKILALNSSNALANNAKAKVAYSKGDFGNMIIYKQKAINYSKYVLEEYLDYCDMLYDGYRIYYENGDQESADICAKYILKIPVDIKRVLDETDALAYKINDIPELELPNRYMRIIDKVQKSQN